VTIVDASEEQRTALQIVENVQRQDLHPLDEAQASAERKPRSMAVSG